jgi:hypothetical protein
MKRRTYFVAWMSIIIGVFPLCAVILLLILDISHPPPQNVLIMIGLVSFFPLVLLALPAVLLLRRRSIGRSILQVVWGLLVLTTGYQMLEGEIVKGIPSPLGVIALICLITDSPEEWVVNDGKNRRRQEDVAGPPAQGTQLFVMRGRTKMGPYTSAEVELRVRNKEFSADVLASRDGETEWLPLCTFVDFS